jgi:hypothetical protein
MKLLLRDIYFEEIKAGKKTVDYRDAHITFVNEDTKEEIVKAVTEVSIIPFDCLPRNLKNTDMFEDKTIIKFILEE